MMDYLTDKNYQLIESYLKGEMSEEERQSFEERLKLEPELKKELELFEMADEAIAIYREDLQLNKWKEKGEKLWDENYGSRFPIRLILQGIAAALIVSFIGWKIFYQPCMNATFVEKYYVNLDVGELRSQAPTPENVSHLESAKTSWKSGEFAAVIESLQKVQPTSAVYIDAQLMMAYAYFKQENYQEAATLYDRVRQQNDIRFSDKAEAMWLLSYVAEGDLESLEKYAKTVEKTADSPNKKMVQDILDQWDNICDEKIESPL